MDNELKIKRLEKIICMYENKVFDVLYEKILYCNICKDILKEHPIRCYNLIYCRNNICKNCFKNYDSSWKCDECNLN